MLYIDWQPSIEVFRIGIFSLKWYSLLWMFGLMIAYLIVKHLYIQQGVPGVVAGTGTWVRHRRPRKFVKYLAVSSIFLLSFKELHYKIW